MLELQPWSAVKVRGRLSTNDGEVALKWALDGHGILTRAEWDLAKYLRNGRLELILEDLRRDYGPWITDYTDPKPCRYHAGLKAGQLSQAGLILQFLLRSVVDCGRYDEADFCRRLDDDLFPQLDGTPMNGPGGYTSQSIREAWRRRVQQGLPWSQAGGQADTTEAIERTLALAVRYALHPHRLADAIAGNTRLTQIDDTVVAMTVAYGAVLGLLVQGEELDTGLSGKNRRVPASSPRPTPCWRRPIWQRPPPIRTSASSRRGRYPSSMACHAPSTTCCRPSITSPRASPTISSPPCSHAINGDGQNQARAILTGALVGAQCGLAGIPRRFVDGLEHAAELEALAIRLASQIGESEPLGEE